MVSFGVKSLGRGDFCPSTVRSLKRLNISWDTPITPCIHLCTHLYTHPRTHPPVSTANCRKLRFTTAIYRFPRQSAVSAKFCKVRGILPNSARTVTMHGAAFINPVTMSMIYTPFSLFLTFFLYATSWLYHIVYVRSLIISTSLYIIAACTHSVTK